MKLNFCKYTGAGNDFIIVDDRKKKFINDSSLIKRLCNRNFGVGADGLILIRDTDNAEFEILHYTPDGYPGSLCGNGTRCGISFAFKNNIIDKKTIFKAYDGIHSADILKDNLIKMKMNLNSEILDNKYGTWLDTGSPHLVIEMDNTDTLNVKKEGSLIRYNNYFKDEGVNVNFVEKVTDEIFKIRTYERGVENETLACGTGSTASAICMNYLGRTNRNIITMKSKGGDLKVEFNSKNKNFSDINIIGPAELVFEGSINI